MRLEGNTVVAPLATSTSSPSTRSMAPRGVIDLVLGDDVDVANGATTVFPSSRIYVMLPPPLGDPGLQRFDSWLRLVTVHELTHVFHLDRVGGVWGVLQRVFGRAPGLFPNAFQPSWVIRSEEHTSELQSLAYLVCRLL